MSSSPKVRALRRLGLDRIAARLRMSPPLKKVKIFEIGEKAHPAAGNEDRKELWLVREMTPVEGYGRWSWLEGPEAIVSKTLLGAYDSGTAGDRGEEGFRRWDQAYAVGSIFLKVPIPSIQEQIEG